MIELAVVGEIIKEQDRPEAGDCWSWGFVLKLSPHFLLMPGDQSPDVNSSVGISQGPAVGPKH